MDPLILLHASGHQRFAFGGDAAFKVYEHRGYTVSLEYYGPTARTVDAVMVIWPSNKPLDAGAWIVARKRAVDYVDRHMNPTPYCLIEADKALRVLGREPGKIELRNLVDTFMHHLDYLMMMPAVPPEAKRAAKGEAWFDIERRNEAQQVIDEAQA